MSATNSQRVSARVPNKVYELLSEAAEISGATMNQFIVQSACEKAREVIEKERFIHMTARSAMAFFEAIDNPPKPTAKLIEAVKRYKEFKNESQD